MVERRKRVRRHLKYYARVTDCTTERFIGYLENLSPIGAMLVSERPFKTGLVHHFCMDVPEGFTPDNRLPFQAQIIWSRPDADPSFYNTGFEFIGLSGREQELIARMIQDERWTLLDTGNTPAEPYNSSGEHQFGEFRPPSTLGEAYAGSGPD